MEHELTIDAETIHQSKARGIIFLVQLTRLILERVELLDNRHIGCRTELAYDPPDEEHHYH